MLNHSHTDESRKRELLNLQNGSSVVLEWMFLTFPLSRNITLNTLSKSVNFAEKIEKVEMIESDYEYVTLDDVEDYEYVVIKCKEAD
jgi:hypothetical protein